MHRRNRRELIDGIARLRLGLEESRIDLLVRYCDEISLWNRKMNLVGGGERDLVVRHLLDSLAAVAALRAVEFFDLEGASIVDVGSGAGLPGIPFAVALPGSRVTLLERSSRRTGFLTTAKLLLGLENVVVTEEDAETHEVRYDLVVCRAYEPYARAVATLARLAGEEGMVAFFAAAPPDPVPEEQGFVRRDLPLVVPFLEARRTLITLCRS